MSGEEFNRKITKLDGPNTFSVLQVSFPSTDSWRLHLTFRLTAMLDGPNTFSVLQVSFPAPGGTYEWVDSCITQLEAQGLSRTCNERDEEEEVVALMEGVYEWVALLEGEYEGHNLFLKSRRCTCRRAWVVGEIGCVCVREREREKGRERTREREKGIVEGA